jgi:PAS domain S-box-containing protein
LKFRGPSGYFPLDLKKSTHIFSIILLAGLAALINHFAPTIYFDNQLMLGGSIGVFALLAFGWTGLLVGVAALVVTALRWGHPFELIIGTLFLVWLKIFLDRFNGGRDRQDNGRIVLAAIGFWFFVGLPLEYLLFRQWFDLSPLKSMTLGLKESAIGLVNTTLGLLLYLMFRYRGIRRGELTIPVRGAVFTTVLLAIIVPAVLIIFINSNALKTAAMEQSYAELRKQAVAWAFGFPIADKSPHHQNQFFRWEKPDGTFVLSDPDKARMLDREYEIEYPNRAGHPGIKLHVPRDDLPVLLADLVSYWAVTVNLQTTPPGTGTNRITVFEPAQPLIDNIDYELSLPGFTILLALLIAGALFSELLSTLTERQLKNMLAPPVGEKLGASHIRELNQLSSLINARNQRVSELNAALNKTQRAAFEVTENIPVGTYTMVQPPDGGLAYFSFMSTRFLELTGLNFEEARSSPMKAFECVHPDDHAEWVRKNIEVFEKKLPFCEECRLIVKGETRWILAESRPRDMDDGSVVWEGVLIDITDRKVAEQKLSESEAELRKILDSIPIGIALNSLEEKPRITFINEHFTKTYGYTIDDIPSVDDFARMAYPDPEYRKRVFEKWNADVATASQISGHVTAAEYRICTRQGIYKDVVISAVVKDDTLICAIVDVTDLRKAERELLDLRQQLEKAAYELTENIPVGTYVVEVKPGETPTYSFCSDRWLQMLDLTREEVMSNPGLPLQRVREDYREAFIALNNDVTSTGKKFQWEGPIVVRDQTRWVNIESIPRPGPNDRTIWEGVMIDVTEKVMATQREREIEQVYRENLESKLKSSLAAAAIGHEINTPLSTLLLQSRQSQKKGSATPEELDVIAREAQHVLRIIEKMKVLMRNVQTEHHPVNLREVVDSALLQVKRPLQEQDIALNLRVTSGKSFMITGDDAQIQIAITNLLRNAIEAIAENDGDQPREILVELGHDLGEVRLVIGDSGPGWTGAEQEELPLSTTKESGTGIGLYIVRTTARNHRARLEFGTSPLGGAEVTLAFPAGV